ALVRITAQSERTMQFQATTRSARAKLGILLEMGSDFFKQTPQYKNHLRVVFVLWTRTARKLLYVRGDSNSGSIFFLLKK
ncbi:MAG: hypothetical protein KBB91_02415, partial [Candidatus Pacebacteria bacterium]|nr:hypothetical protein [Candidatus Paceibacterota bacterium]